MNKKQYLDYLYYKVNKQQEFYLQSQDKDGWFSKRYSYSQICHDTGNNKEKWWLDKVNARTILINEICLDYDPKEGWSKRDLLINVKGFVTKLKELKCNHASVWDTTSQGYHVHIFNDTMYKMSYKQRRSYRLEIFDKFVMYKEFKGKLDTIYPERLKCSENVTINLEHAKHWKTGKTKRLLYET